MLMLFFAFPHDLTDMALEARCDTLLPANEQARWHSYRFPRDRHQSLATRILLRSSLSALHPATPPSVWRFLIGPHGKVYLAQPARFRFNLSNVPELVACLISDLAEVGIDVEPHNRAARILPLAPEVFSDDELDQLTALPSEAQPDRALSLWTLKEAYIKARGKGLALSLQQFSFLFSETGEIRLQIAPSLHDSPSRWQFALLNFQQHRIALVAEASAGRDISIQQFHPLLAPPQHADLSAPIWLPFEEPDSQFI